MRLFLFWFFTLFLSGLASAKDVTIYNGETVKFSSWSAWDQNGSSIVQLKKDSFSKPNHFRATIKNKNWWGGVAYVPNNWNPIDLSKASTISLAVKSPNFRQVGVSLFDINKKSGQTVTLNVTPAYQINSISVNELSSGIDLSKVTAIVFSESLNGSKSVVIDVDDIVASISDTPPPDPTPTPNPDPTPIPSGSTMKTNGRFLYDACGQKVVMRGVNQMTCWTDWVGTPRDGLPMFAEISKTGANVVRIVWISDAGANTPAITIAQLDTAITNAVANGLIPMIENHDKTCMWSTKDVTDVLNWWTTPEMKALIAKHQKYLLINFANEMSAPNKTEYVKEYSRVLTTMRSAGIHVPIVIDSSGCGQDEAMIMNAGPALIAADPDHNVVMSLHIYWMDQNAARIAKAVNDSVALNIPMIIGEFASVSTDCSTPILWKEIIKQAQINQIGYLPWSWDNQNACATHAMTKDNNMSFSTLWGWALELSVTDPNSIKNTSVRSKCMGPAPVPTPTPTPVPSTGGLDLGQDGILQIHAIGDSITSNPGWRCTIYDALTKIGVKTEFLGTVVDAYPKCVQKKSDGHSGYNTSNVYSEVDGWLGSIPKPELTLIMLGTNDVAWWTVEPEADVVARLNKVVDKVKLNSPKGVIFVASIPPEGGPNAGTNVPLLIPPNSRDRNTLVNNYNKGIADMVSKRKDLGDSIYFVDIFPSLTTADLYDGIHPNDVGNQKIGRAFASKITGMLPVKSKKAKMRSNINRLP
jgi:mannan endo-1,4-beta-mannosidase